MIDLCWNKTLVNISRLVAHNAKIIYHKTIHINTITWRRYYSTLLFYDQAHSNSCRPILWKQGEFQLLDSIDKYIHRLKNLHVCVSDERDNMLGRIRADACSIYWFIYTLIML